MARTELPNGVILPAEYSDDWYEDMTSNLTKLDDVIGSDSEKLNSNDVAFLRMSSAALTDGGTGNFSDLNSSNKLKTGDYVLDSNRKLFMIASVDSTNETFTVGNSLFKVTAESDLAPVAESGDYDDLDNKPALKPVATSGDYDDLDNKPALKPVATSGDYDDLDNKPALKPVATSGDYDDLTDLPTYGITRFCSSAITDNSSVAFSAISSTDKIKVGDFLLDTVGKMYQISSVDTSNETVSVTTPLTQLAVDSDVVHKSGNETVAGIKTFSDNIITKKIISNVAQLQINARSNADSVAVIAGADASEGGGIWIYGKNNVNKSHVAIQVYDTDNSTFHAVRLNMDGALTPTVSNNGLGSQSFKWRGFNGINPGALSLPNFSNGIDISGYITLGTTTQTYTAPADGWILIQCRSSMASGCYIEDSSGYGMVCPHLVGYGSNDRISKLCCPVKNNEVYTIVLKSIDISVNAYFYPCLGNV